MSPQYRMGEILRRIASVTSILRVRADDERRAEIAGLPSVIDARVADVVERLERNLEDLEKALA